MSTLRARSLKGILLTLSTSLILAGAAVGSARSVFFLDPDPGSDAVEESQEEPAACPDDGEGSATDPEGSGEANEEEAGPSEEAKPAEDCDLEEGEGSEGEGSKDDPEGDDPEGESEEGETDPVVLAEREAECMAAAGLEEQPVPEGERLRGLDNAVSRVLENCAKNPQAPGLIVALERLAENRAKQEAKKEARAERREGREKGGKRSDAKVAQGPGHGGTPPGLEKGSGGAPAHAGGPPGSNGKGKAKGKGSGR